jgi:hypothetical protein
VEESHAAIVPQLAFQSFCVLPQTCIDSNTAKAPMQITENKISIATGSLSGRRFLTF